MIFTYLSGLLIYFNFKNCRTTCFWNWIFGCWYNFKRSSCRGIPSLDVVYDADGASRLERYCSNYANRVFSRNAGTLS